MPGVTIELHVTGQVQKLKEGSYYEVDESFSQSAGEFTRQMAQIEQDKAAGQKLIQQTSDEERTSPISPVEVMNRVAQTSGVIANLSEEERADNLRRLSAANQGLAQMSLEDNAKRKRKRKRGKRGGKGKVSIGGVPVVQSNNVPESRGIISVKVPVEKRNDPIW